MKRFWIFLTYSSLAFLHADTTTFSKDRLVNFYDEFVCEEKDVLAQVNLSQPCNSVGRLPDPPPPAPPPNPSAPPSMSGLLPIVIMNNSGLPDRKSTRLNSSHIQKSRMPSSA